MLDNGADINFQDFHNKTSLHYAAKYGHRPVVKILLDAGAVLNLLDTLNLAPKDLCSKKPDHEAIKNALVNSITLSLKCMKCAQMIHVRDPRLYRRGRYIRKT